MTNTQQFIPNFLNNGNNTTLLNGLSPGYGTNFIDILFKHMMESGLQGLSLMALLQLYAYLSLDRIKDLFKYFNDKLAEHGKAKLELWCGWLGTLFNTWVEGSAIACWKFGADLCYRVFKGRRPRNPSQSPMKGFAPGVLVTPSDGKNSYIVGIDASNRVDVMAICNYLLQERERLGINDICTRVETSKRHTDELFTLPEELNIGTGDGVDIRFVQNVKLAMNCESNHQEEETVRDYILNSEVVKTTNGLKNLDEFVALLANVLEPLSDLTDDDGNALSWPGLVVCNYWSCSPPCIANSGPGGPLEKLWVLVYLSRNARLLETMIRFFSGAESLSYGGKEYTLNEPFWDGMEVGKKINSSTGIKELSKALDTDYRTQMIELMDDLEHPVTQEYMSAAQTLVQMVEAKADTSDPMYIEFKSETMKDHELDAYGREWMNQRIQSYYQDTTQRAGDKIGVYKMYIEYKKEQIDVLNPAFQEFLDKLGMNEEEYDTMKEEKEEKKRKEEEEKKKKKDDEKEKGESEGEDSVEDDSKQNKKKKGGKGGSKGVAWPPHLGTPGAHYGAWAPREPQVPPKMIKKDKLIPKCKCKLIKRDRKPLEYLYLPKHTMNSLDKYLNNFKSNRERFEKFGLPYRGGILLSGVPGCGKSSTILATATFLRKDIFYLDLGALKTNEELKLCVDYIRNNSKNGGVIIFEDIDCMTDIVLRRGDGDGYDGSAADSSTATTESLTAATANASKMSTLDNANPNGSNTGTGGNGSGDEDNSDALSLSFLLNVLDGTMAPEDVIFMMTTNRKHLLDPALIRAGRIDLSFHVNHCTRYQLINIYKDLYDKNMPEDIVERFPENTHITAKVILHLFHNSFNSNLDVYGLMKPFLDKTD